MGRGEDQGGPQMCSHRKASFTLRKSSRPMDKNDSLRIPKLMHIYEPANRLKRPRLALVQDQGAGFGADYKPEDKALWGKDHGQRLGFRHSHQSAGSHPEPLSGAMVVSPPIAGKDGSAHDRASFFAALSAGEWAGPVGEREAKTLYDLIIIRACNSKLLQKYSSVLGTAIGLRTVEGKFTSQPAVVVYVSRKVNDTWLDKEERLPDRLRGPDGLWCDLDVVEFAEGVTQSRTESYSGLTDGLRGGDASIGPGSQVATAELYGTLGAIVRCKRDGKKMGFITNRHVSVDLDRPLQRIYHPLPPMLGANMYLGTVERAVSYATDHLWYGIFCGPNPDSFVRADGAFVPFPEDFDMSLIDTKLKGVGELGPVFDVDLKLPVASIVGRTVYKVGRTTGLTTGVIMAYAVEYDESKGVTVYTDFLVLGEDNRPFDAEGDSGSLIVMRNEGNVPPSPIGIVWGGTVNHGGLKLRNGIGPENWTSGIGLARLMALLDVELMTSLDTPIQGEQQDGARAHVSGPQASNQQASTSQSSRMNNSSADRGVGEVKRQKTR